MDRKKTCLIISGGDFCPLPDDLQGNTYDLVIACDRGWEHARRLSVKPDRIVGDFDSSPVPETDVPVDRAPTHKDDTDTMLAVRYALSEGCQDVVICCAFGGRLDHTLANIQTAAFLASRGAAARLTGVDTDLLAFSSGSRSILRREGWSLSVFALSDRCEGVSISGTKYTCEGVMLTAAFPLGVSNVWTSPEARVTVEQGILAVMQCRLRPGEHI